MKTNNYTITLRTTMLTPAGADILSRLNKEEKITDKVTFEFQKTGNQLKAFINNDCIGIVQNIEDEKRNIFKNDVIIEATKGKYEAFIDKLSTTPKCFEVLFKEILPEKAEIKSDSSFKEETERIVSEGITTREEIDERIKCMRSNGVPDGIIHLVLDNYKEYSKPVKRPKTLYRDPTVGKEKETIFTRMISQTLVGRATIYEGDKSVGKNVASETLAWVLGMPYFLITFNRMLTQDEIYGTKSTAEPKLIKMTDDEAVNLAKKDKETFDVLCAKAATVQIKQEISQLTEWLSSGGVMCFNEMNMADSNFFGSFTNQITDGTGFLDVPGIGRVYINPNCVLVGNQNKGYTGAMEQNEATMSRFGCIQFDYPASIKEILMASAKIAKKNNLDEQYYEQCDKLYKIYLAAVRKGQSISNAVLNIRGFVSALDAVSLLPGFITLSSEIEINVINTCPEEDRAVLITTLKDVITL
ncbi:MAG: AAA family ATPase [Lachnospiraceae bacterium]|nr:AAA family ATPase [Lachnospiraceae bacterium]